MTDALNPDALVRPLRPALARARIDSGMAVCSTCGYWDVSDTHPLINGSGRCRMVIAPHGLRLTDGQPPGMEDVDPGERYPHTPPGAVCDMWLPPGTPSARPSRTIRESGVR